MTKAAVAEYLLDRETEDGIIECHRHRILLAFPALVLAAGLIASIALPKVWWVIIPALGWYWWRWINWRSYWFVLTTKRILVVSGVFSHNVGLMPLNRLTDMSFRESWIGQRLGWGKIVVESAGQDQALHVINWLPNPKELYLEISNQVFGDDDE